ncbi:MAG: hypothetical protein IT462_08170 [Planctomycetes bacterium]|nr:hypothetical protein [Planctomycetota bacterium]
MLRASRRGLADLPGLIVMIVMIVFLIGMGAMAFVASDKATKEQSYLARLRELPENQRAEIDSTRARFAQVSGLIGFKGQADFSSPEVIKELVAQGGLIAKRYYKFDATGADKKGIISGVGFSGDAAKRTATVSQTSRNNSILYETGDGFTLQRAIAAQDALVNDLVSDHIPKMKQQRELQRKWRNDSVVVAKAASEANFNNITGKIYGMVNDLKVTNDAAVQAEVALTTSLTDEMVAADGLVRGDTMKQEVAKKLKAMMDTEPSRREAEIAQSQFRSKAAGRLVDDTHDPDGYVFLVDEISGWLWINIGQLSDVRLEQTFTVYRPEASTSSMARIGEIRVKEIMQGNIARCRVDNLVEDKIYPRAGDVVMNETFSSRQYHSYALVGRFGGTDTSMTRQEWIDKLTSLGFRVDSSIRMDTDAVLLGADWAIDPQYTDARDRRVEFQTFTEREMFWFLGLSGPDGK